MSREEPPNDRFAWTRAFWFGRGHAPFPFRLWSLVLLLAGAAGSTLVDWSRLVSVAAAFAAVLCGQLLADVLLR